MTYVGTTSYSPRSLNFLKLSIVLQKRWSIMEQTVISQMEGGVDALVGKDQSKNLYAYRHNHGHR